MFEKCNVKGIDRYRLYTLGKYMYEKSEYDTTLSSGLGEWENIYRGEQYERMEVGEKNKNNYIEKYSN